MKSMNNDFIQYSELYHHGIKGMRWGIRRYQNADGTLTAEGKKRYFNNDGTLTKAGRKEYLGTKKLSDEEAYRKRKKIIAAAAIGLGLGIVSVSAINHYKTLSKKYVDQVLKEGSTVNTLIRDPKRLKKSEYLFEAHDFIDKQQYRSRFGKYLERDPKTRKILSKTPKFKLDATNVVSNKDMRIASEQSAAESFVNMYKNNKGFKKYIDNAYNKGGMSMDAFKEARRLNFPEFKKANKILKNKSGNYSDDDLRQIYKIFNFNVVSQDKQTKKYRKQFFNALKKRGYSGLIDVNDTMYGGYHTNASNIIFDTKNLTLKNLEQLTDKEISKARIIDGFTFLHNPYHLKKVFGTTAVGLSGLGIANEANYRRKKKAANKK